ncbi:MAG: hypothetical protein SGPRY_006834, partial [Prymnesium sp.]
MAEGVTEPVGMQLDSIEHWKTLLCSPSQSLVHFVDGRASLVVDVRGGADNPLAPTLILGDANLEETGTLSAFNLLHANAPEDGVDYIVRGFVGGRFSSARRMVRVSSLESSTKGSITSVMAEVISAASSSTTPVERMKRTLPPFVKEFILQPSRQRLLEEWSREQESPREEPPAKRLESRTRGEGKKPVSRLRFDLSQLKHLREALSLFGVVKMDQKSTAWATMEKILSAAFDRDVSDGKDMAKHSASLDSAILKNKGCMQHFEHLAVDKSGGSWSPGEVGIALRVAFMRKQTTSQEQKKRKAIIPSLPPPLSAISESEEDNLYLSAGDESSFGSPPPPAKKLAKVFKSRTVELSDNSEQEASPSPSPMKLSTLGRIQPPNTSKLEAAHIFFGDEIILEAAK